MTTDRQKGAVSFCEDWLPNITFRSYCEARFGNWREGYINNFSAVSGFLSLYLDDAKWEAESHTDAYYPMAIFRYHPEVFGEISSK